MKTNKKYKQITLVKPPSHFDPRQASYRDWMGIIDNGYYTTFSNYIAMITSAEEAVVLSRFNYLYNSSKQNTKGWVPIVLSFLCVPCGVSYFATQKIIKKWVNEGCIECVKKGIPPKIWYKVNEVKMERYLYKQSQKEPQNKQYFIRALGVTKKIKIDEESPVRRIQHTISSNTTNRNVEHDEHINSIVKTINTPLKNRPPNEIALLEPDTVHKTKLDAYAHKLTIKFIKVLQRHRKIMRKPNSDKWRKAMSILIKELDGTIKQNYLSINLMIDKYDHFIKEKFIPKAYSVTQFAEKYDQIANAIENFVVRDETVNKQNIKPSDLESIEYNIYESVSEMKWKQGSYELLPYAVRESYTNYTKYILYVDRLCSKNKLSEDAIGFIQSLEFRNSMAGCTVITNALPSYFKKINNMVSKWEEWNGDLSKYVWDINNTLIQKSGKSASMEYCGSSRLWNELMGALK